MPLQSALFFDRDNTLVADHGYLHKIEDFRWLAGAPEALKFAASLNLPVFIVTNQGGIGRGLFTEQDMHRFNTHLMQKAQQAGGKITDIAFCPHHPNAISSYLKTPCSCRKPAPGMFYTLAKKWNIDLSASIMIGDRASDIEAGKAAGCKTALFDPTSNLLDCVRLALEEIGIVH